MIARLALAALVFAVSFVEPAEARRGRGYHRHHVAHYREARRGPKSVRQRARAYSEDDDRPPTPAALSRELPRCKMPPRDPDPDLTAVPLDTRWPWTRLSMNPLPKWDRR